MLQDQDRVAEPPSRDYLLGTDDLGRDMLSRNMWSAHIAGIVAIISTMFSLILGIILGGIAAYMGSWADWLISRAVDVTMSIPQLLFASPMAAIFRKPVSDWVDKMYASTGIEFFSTPTYVVLIVIFGALALIQWPCYARLIRGQILSLREKELIEAARAVGVSQTKVLLKHLIPNALGPLIVAVTFGFGSAIVAESGLSYLGIGVQPPQASWGAMIADNQLSWRYRPWLVKVPGLTIAIVSRGNQLSRRRSEPCAEPAPGRFLSVFRAVAIFQITLSTCRWRLSKKFASWLPVISRICSVRYQTG